METVSKKRGRPDVFSRDYGENAEIGRKAAEVVFEGCERTLANGHYVLEGMRIATEIYGKEKTQEVFSFPSGKFKNACILEQIGRMRLQDGYSADDCAVILKEAVSLREKEGFTAKQAAQWIRRGRPSGVFGE